MSPRYCSPSTTMSIPSLSCVSIQNAVAFSSSFFSTSAEILPLANSVRRCISAGGFGKLPTVVVGNNGRSNPSFFSLFRSIFLPLVHAISNFRQALQFRLGAVPRQIFQAGGGIQITFLGPNIGQDRFQRAKHRCGVIQTGVAAVEQSETERLRRFGFCDPLH